MGIIKTHDDFEHPEGKIQLLDGTVLDCYPLEQAGEQVDNEMKLDTTGTYLEVGKGKPAAQPNSEEEKEKDRKLFLDNAFLFLQHRDRIMADSRMFLCPVPIQSGLAYTGTSGFYRPTLGVYLEWWLNCENASICKNDETKWLVYHIAGSPLSGSNHCGIVNESGKTKSESFSSFSSLWPSFMRINSRFDEAKSLYQAYTLEEVVKILKEEGRTKIDDKGIHILFLKIALRKKHIELTKKIEYYEGEIDKLKFQLFSSHRAGLEAIMAVYKEKEEKKKKREDEINAECKELYRQLKSGEIDNKQYQKQLTPLKKEREHNKYLLEDYRREALNELFPDMRYTLDDAERFFNDPRLK